MDTEATAGFLEQVNEQLDPVALLKRIGYAVDKVQVVGDSVKAFCPIHKDSRFRSLLVDSKKRTFKCTIKTCAGFGGGTLVELFALARGLDRLAATADLVGAMDLQVDPSWMGRMGATFLDEAERAFVSHEHEAAESAARRALQFQTDLLEARLLLANIHAAKGESAQACEEFIAVAESYLAKEAWEEADRTLERAAVDFPQNEDLVFLQVRSAEQQGRKDEAIRLLEEIARRRESAGRTVDNVGIYEQLIEAKPDDLDLRLKLADAHEQRRDIRSACRELEAVARVHIDQQRAGAAISLLEKVLQFEPQMTHLRLLLAEELVKEGEYPRAKAQILDVISAQMEVSDFTSAVLTARKWLEIEPESIEAHESLASIWQEQGNNQEAAKELEIAGDIARREGDPDRALELLYRASFILPEETGIRRQIIDLLKLLKQTDKAMFELVNLADALFSQDRGDEGEKALLDGVHDCESSAIRLQVAGNLRSHCRMDSAAGLYLAVASKSEQEDDLAGAVGCYQSYIELRPDDLAVATKYCRLLWEVDLRSLAASTTVQLGLRLLDAGDPAGAGELVRIAAQNPPDDSAMIRQLLDLALTVPEPSAAQTFYPLAAATLADSEPAVALELAGRVLGLCPDDEAVLRDLATLHRRTGDPLTASDVLVKLADLCERRGDFAAALSHLAGALENDPSRSFIHKRRSRLLSDLDDPELARSARLEYIRSLKASGTTGDLLGEYGQYLEQWPGDRSVRREYSDALASAGKRDEAVAQLEVVLKGVDAAADPAAANEIREALLQLDPGNTVLKHDLALGFCACGEPDRALPLLCSVAEEFLSASEFTGAVSAARKAHELKPDDVGILERLAGAEKSSGDFASYEASLVKLVALGNTNAAVPWYAENAARLARKGKHREAEEYARRWMDAAPDDPDALEQMARIYRQQKRSQRAVESYLGLADLLRRQSKPERVAEVLREALEVEPENVPVRQLLWQALLDAGREPEAIDEMQQLADIHVDRRDYKDAATLLSRILEYRTNSADTLRRLASLVHEFEGFAKAQPYFRKLLALRRDSSGPEAVAAEYEAILKLEGAEIDFRIEYADFLESAGQSKAAKSQLLQVAQVFRDELNDPVRAIEFLGRATTVQPGPEDARIFEELASLHIAVKVPRFAAEALREAVRLYDEAGAVDNALGAQRKLVELSGCQTGDYVHLGALLAKAGLKPEAVTAYRHALALVEDSPTATTGEKVQVCERLIGIAPLDLAAATTLVDALSGEDAAKRALELAAVFGSAGLPGEQIQLLERAKSAAPREVKIRRELTEVWRTSGNQEKLTAELLGICEVAKGKHAARVREAALEELSGLPSTPELALQLAPLFLAAGNTDKAVESYCSAAEQLCEAGRFGECADAMRTVCTLEAASVPSALVAALIRKSDFADEVRPAVEQVLDAALLARSRTRTLVICAAMLESCRAGEVRQVLSRVFEKSGAAFLSAVAGVHLDWLLDRNRKDGAREIVDFIVSIAPSSPDVWWLASQTHRKAGDPERSKEASIQAAKLFSQAGAVTEEETCYREVLEETPDDAAVLETLVSLYEREHRVPDALELMRRLADLALKSGDHLGAVRWLGKLVENEPDNTDCREKLAEQLIQSAQPAEAAAELFELGRAYTTQGATEKAFAAYERILVLEPESEEAVTALVALAEKSNDAGRYSRCSQMLADVKAARGEVQEACRILRLLAEKEPDNLKVLEKLLRAAHGAHDNRAREYALRTLGYKHAKRGEHEAAVTSFEQLLGLCPGERDTVQMLVDCCAAGGLGQKAADYSSMLLETVRGQGDNTRICEAARAVLAFDAKRAPARRDLAEALFALGNPEEAVVEWTQAADDFEAAKNHADAESCLVRVTATTPGDAGAWRRYIQVLSVTGSEDAVAEARLRLAEALAEAGDIDAAEEALEQVLADAPGRPEIHERILAFYRRCGTASEILPELVWLAHYHLFHGDLDAAEQHVKEGLETDSEDMTLLECRIEIVRRQGKRDELQFRLRQLAQNCIGHGDLRKAADVFGEMVGEDPGLVDVRRELADLLLKLGEEERACNEFAELVAVQLGRSEVEDARETAEAALAVRPDDILLRARFAKVFADNRLPEIAGRHYMACAANAIARGAAAQQIEYLKQAVETRPRWVESLSQLAGACVAAGESAGALDALARLTEVLLDQKRVHEAIDALRRQVQLAPRDASLRRRLIDLLEVTGDRESRTAQLQELGDLFISLGDVEEAVETYRLLTSLKPGDAATLHRFIELFAQVGNELEVIDDYLRLAEIYAKTGSFEEATRTFERVLAIDRRQRDAREKFIVFLQHAGQKSRAVTEMVKLAEMHSSVCDFVAAAQTLTKAAMLSPHDVNVTEALGEAHALAGNTTAAAEALLKVVRSASGSDPARAVAACRRVVEIDPDNVDAREVIGDLLFGFGERAEAAGNARSLAQLYRSAGQVARAEALEQKAREYEPETVESMRELIRQHEGDQRQLLEDYVRYGDLLAAAGEIDGALGAYREARGIRDDNPELIRKYVNVLMQIAPEHEAIPDLIALAKGYEKTGAVLRALAAYEQVLKLDGKNSIAKAGRRRMREMSNAD